MKPAYIAFVLNAAIGSVDIGIATGNPFWGAAAFHAALVFGMAVLVHATKRG